MKITIIGHSLVHPRQYFFAQAIRELGHEVQEIYPSRWFNLTREGGYEVDFTKGIAGYTFPEKAFYDIEKFGPDVIYSMSEVWQAQTLLSVNWARRLNTKCVLFVWENKDLHFFEVPKGTYVIAGNSEAAKLHNTQYILPQVGLNTDLFKPMEVDKEYDLIYVGREVEEKGINYIKNSAEKLNLKLLIVSNKRYEDIPELLNKSRVMVSYPFETNFWKPQFEYNLAEAMSCGLPVITSNAGSIPDVYFSSPAIIIPQRDQYMLTKTIKTIINDKKRMMNLGEAGVKWVRYNLSNKIIAKRLIQIFEEI